MSSQKSGSTVVSELARQVISQLRVAPGTERTLAQLYERIEAEDLVQLHAVVWALVRRGRVEAMFRVRSPYGEHGNLGYFVAFDEIPEVMIDEWLDEPQSFRVTDDDVEVVFREAHEETPR